MTTCKAGTLLTRGSVNNFHLVRFICLGTVLRLNLNVSLILNKPFPHFQHPYPSEVFPFNGYLATFQNLPFAVNLNNLPLDTELEYFLALENSHMGTGIGDFDNTLTFDPDNPFVFGEFDNDIFIPHRTNTPLVFNLHRAA